MDYPKPTKEEILEWIKQDKIKELEQSSSEYKSRSVPVKIGSKTYHFFGGRINAQKYKEAFDIAQAVGVSKGEVGVEEGLIEVTEEQMTTALTAIGLQVYKGWKKLQYYKQAVENANTIEEVEAIVWEDERS